jgi:hypothetical protein
MFEKKEKKKTKPCRLPFQPKRPSGPSAITPRWPTSLSLFLFPLLSLTPGSHLSASLLPLPFLLPPARRPLPQPRGIRRALAFSPSFLFPASTPIKAINPPLKSPAVSPFPLAFFTPGRPAGHQWQATGRPVPFLLRLPPCAPT